MVVGGGSNAYFEGGKPDRSGSMNWIPNIGRGADMSAVLKILAGPMIERLSRMKSGDSIHDISVIDHFDKDKVNAELAKLPDKPDDTLV